MRAAIPAHIVAGGVLWIPEKKRIRNVRITQAGEPAGDKRESGIAALQRIGAVCSGNMEHIQAVILVDIHILRSQAQPRISDNGIQDDVRTKCISATDGRALHKTRGRSRLTAVGGIAARRAERGRIEDVRSARGYNGRRSACCRWGRN